METSYDPAKCSNCGYTKHEKTFQRDRCPKCNKSNIWTQLKESHMPPLTVKLLEAIKANDWHGANETFAATMRTRMNERLADIKTRVFMEGKGCQDCGSTKNLSEPDDEGDVYCSKCDPDLKEAEDKDVDTTIKECGCGMPGCKDCEK